MESIDIHFHIAPPSYVDALRRDGVGGTARLDVGPDGVDRLFLNLPEGSPLENGAPLFPALYDERLIIAGMDRMGIDIAAISVTPLLFYQWCPPDVGLRAARLINDGIAEMVRAQPDRFVGLAILPMQDAALAADELQRCVRELGLHGAAICTNVNGVDLDHPDLRPVWAKAQELSVPFFMHPQNGSDVRRLLPYHLTNLVGFPTETATAVAHLIFGGVFERYPGLRVVLAHGGGYFPYQVGRLDHGWEVRSECKVHISRPPSAYLGNVYFDSLIHHDVARRYLVDLVGSDHVVIGTDHPFDMSTGEPVAEIRRLGLSPAEEGKVLGGTLATMLGIG